MKNFQEIVEKIARENGTTPEQVLADMQKVIDDAYSNHPGEEAQLWNRVAPGGVKPTPEAFVARIRRILEEDNQA